RVSFFLTRGELIVRVVLSNAVDIRPVDGCAVLLLSMKTSCRIPERNEMVSLSPRRLWLIWSANSG
ncbi:hypothetical protein OAG10_07540, partial [Verrucomicrobia bacterium]|nr:hypothetical protein [Verrucomicrobiota bacterium]